jgi:ferredoxin-thioredoxin reductase catalytic subunit
MGAEMKKRLEAFAQQAGWKINDNEAVVAALVTALEHNEKKFGVPLCPCVFLPEKDICAAPLIHHRCPCSDATGMIEAVGQCHCGLFQKS